MQRRPRIIEGRCSRRRSRSRCPLSRQLVFRCLPFPFPPPPPLCNSWHRLPFDHTDTHDGLLWFRAQRRAHYGALRLGWRRGPRAAIRLVLPMEKGISWRRRSAIALIWQAASATLGTSSPFPHLSLPQTVHESWQG